MTAIASVFLVVSTMIDDSCDLRFEILDWELYLIAMKQVRRYEIFAIF